MKTVGRDNTHTDTRQTETMERRVYLNSHCYSLTPLTSLLSLFFSLCDRCRSSVAQSFELLIDTSTSQLTAGCRRALQDITDRQQQSALWKHILTQTTAEQQSAARHHTTHRRDQRHVTMQYSFVHALILVCMCCLYSGLVCGALCRCLPCVHFISIFVFIIRML